MQMEGLQVVANASSCIYGPPISNDSYGRLSVSICRAVQKSYLRVSHLRLEIKPGIQRVEIILHHSATPTTTYLDAHQQKVEANHNVGLGNVQQQRNYNCRAHVLEPTNCEIIIISPKEIDSPQKLEYIRGMFWFLPKIAGTGGSGIDDGGDPRNIDKPGYENKH